MMTDWIDAPIRLPAGQHEFAIGDVHGMAIPFEAMLHEMGEQSQGKAHLTLLGDLCDRGPNTLGCYRAALGPAPADLNFADVTMLVGNHEGMMLGAVESGNRLFRRECLHLWRQNGGEEVIKEMGMASNISDVDHVTSMLRASLGDAIFDRLRAAESHRMVGNLLFVHAGIMPGVPLDRWFDAPKSFIDSEDHFSWIRWPFLEHDGPYDGDLLVIHGHTPEYKVRYWKGEPKNIGHHAFDGFRLGLDGGSYESGIVAGAEFRDGAYRIFTSK